MTRKLLHSLLPLVFLYLLLSRPAQATEPVGRWRGSWTSLSSGHRGPLRARVRPIDANTYRALFAGRFAGVVPFVYPSTLQRVPGSSARFQTSTRLPLLGEYRMTAYVSNHRFFARYSSKRDQGVFDLSR
ncbi:MAG: hypothetical protein AAFU85_16855 [Planctomycetota bacterium]